VPKFFPVLLPALLLAVSGCAATKRAHVSTALQDAGMTEADARCLAKPLVRDLNTSQLKTLKRISVLAKSESGGMSEEQLMATLHENLDPQTVEAVIGAVSECFMGG